MKLPKLVEKEIYLRAITMTDVSDRYVSWLNDPEVNQFLETRFAEQNLEAVAAFVQSKIDSNDEYLFAICLADMDRHIGNIKLGPVNPHHKHGDVSLFIGEKDCWGKGYATAAIRLITDWAFRNLGLIKLNAGCYAENEGSARAFERCGYKREGLERDQFIYRGRPTDSILLGLTAREYSS